LCQTIFPTVHNARIHVKRHHCADSVLCTLCQRVSKNPHSFREHLRNRHQLSGVSNAVEHYGKIIAQTSDLLNN
jgi:hypothetical protein